MKLIVVLVHYGVFAGRATRRFYTVAPTIEEGIAHVQNWVYRRWGPDNYKRRDPRFSGAVVADGVAEA